jgi:hypothetical protein
MANSATPMISAKNQYLIKRWKKRIAATESVLGPMSLDRKVALAVSLENTHHRIKTFEATQPGAIG